MKYEPFTMEQGVWKRVVHKGAMEQKRKSVHNGVAGLSGHGGMRQGMLASGQTIFGAPRGQPIGTPRQTIFGAPGATYRHPGQGILAPPGARNYGVGERWKVRMQN
ncbi:MAG: hypothetical protein MUP49_00170 [Dehalococcoidia bacterium]|nr:hypothetical protein [Dehalococcoidia bacterium]